MMTRTFRDRCLVAAGALLAGGLLLAAAAPVQAQNTQLNPRWQAWVGCWEPVGNEPLAADRATTAGEVCVMPSASASSGSAIDLASVDNGKILSRETIAPNGERQPVSEDGCTGWRSAVWSSEGRRVYLHSELSCAGGLKRTSNGVLAISPEGELLDVRGVSAGAGSGVRILRYREAAPAQTLPSVAALLQDRSLAVSTARTAAEAPVTAADVIEASKHLDAAVLQSWLVARNQGFNLDGKQLVQLADAGVPGPVIDAMVALSYPKVFAISPSTPAGTFRQAAPQQVASTDDYYNEPPTSVIMLDPYGYSPFGWGYFSPFGYSAFGYPGYGYSPYGFGFGYGWYSGYNPVVIVRTNPDAPSTSHGKVVKGRGYTQGAGSSNGGTATPTSRMAHPRSASPSGYTGGGVSTSTTSGAGATTVRTAHKRP
ncbi:MAG TPA: hypothetical protein VF166_03290 [Gemmatimonadaceae bacterium]